MGHTAAQDLHTIRMCLRLTPEENELLDEQAERFGKTRSGFLRLALYAVALFVEGMEVEGGPILYLDPMTWRLFLMEFRLHGVNLNQCARACNSIARKIEYHADEMLGDDRCIQEILATLKHVEELSMEMMKELKPLGERFETTLACKQLIKTKKEYKREWAENRQKSRETQNRR